MGDEQVDASTVEQTKQQIRSLVREIAQLSKSELSADQYYAEVLHRIVTALAAVGGAIWTLTNDRRLRVDCQINLSQQLLEPDNDDSTRHLRLLQQVIQSNEPRLVAPLSSFGEENQLGNPTNTLLVLAPLRTNEKVEGVLEIFQRPDAQPGAQQGYLRFLSEMSELIGDWLKSRKLAQFTDRQQLWTQIDTFARSIHETLDLRQTAFTVANEGRRLVGCDRLSVAVRRGAKDNIEAVSGQDVLDNRSNVIRLLRNLTRRVTATGEPLWFDGDSTDLPPQVESALQEYIDECHTKSLAVLPLRKPVAEVSKDDELGGDQETVERKGGDVIGALIVEFIESKPSRLAIEPRAEMVSHHSARALSNSLEHNNLFLMPVWRSLGRAQWLIRAQTLPKTVAISAAVLLVTLVLAFWPADFKLRAASYLDPREKRDVYFDAQGTVRAVHVEHGDPVTEGMLLAELYDIELEQQLTKLVGDRAQYETQIKSTGDILMKRDFDAMSPSERSGYQSEQNEARTQLLTVNNQIALLESKKKRLKVESTLNGIVISWDVKTSLMGRPVQRGDRAMELAITEGDWDLVIKMPEKFVGHLSRATNDLGEDLKVEYVLKSTPGEIYTGTVREIYKSAEWDEEEQTPIVKLRVDIDKSELPDLRPDMTATAKVVCGKRKLWYVLFHELIEWVQINVIFRFQ